MERRLIGAFYRYNWLQSIRYYGGRNAERLCTFRFEKYNIVKLILASAYTVYTSRKMSAIKHRLGLHSTLSLSSCVISRCNEVNLTIRRRPSSDSLLTCITTNKHSKQKRANKTFLDADKAPLNFLTAHGCIYTKYMTALGFPAQDLTEFWPLWLSMAGTLKKIRRNFSLLK